MQSEHVMWSLAAEQDPSPDEQHSQSSVSAKVQDCKRTASSNHSALIRRANQFHVRLTVS